VILKGLNFFYGGAGRGYGGGGRICRYSKWNDNNFKTRPNSVNNILRAIAFCTPTIASCTPSFFRNSIIILAKIFKEKVRVL